jgi:hypothetical protein
MCNINCALLLPLLRARLLPLLQAMAVARHPLVAQALVGQALAALGQVASGTRGAGGHPCMTPQHPRGALLPVTHHHLLVSAGAGVTAAGAQVPTEVALLLLLARGQAETAGRRSSSSSLVKQQQVQASCSSSGGRMVAMGCTLLLRPCHLVGWGPLVNLAALAGQQQQQQQGLATVTRRV